MFKEPLKGLNKLIHKRNNKPIHEKVSRKKTSQAFHFG